jgi:hypothetical protein
MIQHDGSFDAKSIILLLLFLLAPLISACGSNEAIETQAEAEPEEPPLAVQEWYPSSKYQQHPPTAYTPATIPQAPVMTSPQATGFPSQQPWAVNAPQPVYVAPQVIYQVPQPQPQQQVQQPTVWSAPAPATVPLQPQTYWYQPAPQAQVQPQPSYYYQPAPRPWGNPTQPADPQQPAVTTDAWPQGGYIVTPWGVPASGFNAPGTTPGQAYQPLGTPNFGQVW